MTHAFHHIAGLVVVRVAKILATCLCQQVRTLHSHAVELLQNLRIMRNYALASLKAPGGHHLRKFETESGIFSQNS